LWNKYSNTTKDLETATIKIDKAIDKEVEDSAPLRALLATESTSCFVKSITKDLVVFPSGVTTFSNLSSALSKRGGLK
jgi:hypothetical protein